MQLPITVDMGCRKAIRRRMWEANRMFREMLFRVFAPDVVTYNCLIDGCCKTNRIGRALELFEDMKKRESVPNSVTNEIERGVEMMRMMGHGVPGSSTNTPLIHALVETRRVAEARGDGGGRLVLDALTSEGMMVHKRMRQGIDQRYRSAMEIKPEAATTLSQIEQPLVTETVSKKQALKLLEAELKPLKKSIIKHDLLKNRNFKKARFLLDQMQLPITVDMGCRKAIRRRMWEANRMFREMLFRVFAPDVKRECVPNSVTNEIERGVEMMRMMGHGVPGSSTNTPLIHALVETRRVAEARGDGGGRLVLDALTSEGMMVHKRMRQGIDQRYRSAMEIKPSSHPNKGSLVKSLREAATTLSQIEQPLVTETVSKKQALKLLEAELKPLKKSIIKHDLLKNLTVCVSESFRILAPEPPFEDKYLRDIFNLFLAEFSDTGALSTEFSSSEEC
ncbi:hypothetical protein HID58_057842 [Brassica napus]|uniref:Pentatricopeptide repeat-containing protein n=1 Tax=Brassica napus TaxID=3708 RepID=A0ABQ7XF86_BRANA|nr:hypothetical protein HID58_057842 [Brassica napus]